MTTTQLLAAAQGLAKEGPKDDYSRSINFAEKDGKVDTSTINLAVSNIATYSNTKNGFTFAFIPVEKFAEFLIEGQKHLEKMIQDAN